MDDTDRAILELEQQWFRHAGAKEAAIRELGISTTPFYARLNRLIDDPAAVLEFPQLTARLRRLRAERHARRSPRRAS